MHSRIVATSGASVLDALAPLELVGLDALMDRTRGSSEIPVGLIDGPVDVEHPELADATLRGVAPGGAGVCVEPGSVGCRHGTFTAGILAARRSSAAPAICPDSPLLIRPIFTELGGAATVGPGATPAELAASIDDCVGAGARIVNLSAELVASGGDREQAALTGALDQAARRGVIVIAAAGNRAVLDGGVLSRHPWVLTVAACDRRGGPLPGSNLGASIGRRGVLAPGDAIVSLAPGGATTVLSGTSAAAAFVSGAVALAWSLAPDAAGPAVRWALTRAHAMRRPSVVPPLLRAPAVVAQLVSARGDGGG